MKKYYSDFIFSQISDSSNQWTALNHCLNFCIQLNTDSYLFNRLYMGSVHLQEANEPS